MGIFDFLDNSSSGTHAFWSTPVSKLFALESPRAPGQEISFKIEKSPYSPRWTQRVDPQCSVAIHHPRPANRLPHIPIEIILIIIESIHLDEHLECNTPLLLACSLVCRAWARPIQRLLFTDVRLKSGRTLEAFRRAVRTNPRLGDTVMRLRLSLDYNTADSGAERSFAGAMALCPNLYALDIAVYPRSIGSLSTTRDGRSFHAHTLAALRSGPSIRALKLTHWADDSKMLFQLLNIYPNVSLLALCGTPPLRAPLPVAPPTQALDTIRLNLHPPPSLEFTKWLLSSSHNSVRTLDIGRELPPHIIGFLSSTFSQTLHSLMTPVLSACTFKGCSELQELVVERLGGSIPFSAMPGLQHIAFGMDRNTTLQAVIDFIRAGGKEKNGAEGPRNIPLATVTVHLWHGGDVHPQLACLKMACACRDVELRVTRDITVFRALVVRVPLSIILCS